MKNQELDDYKKYVQEQLAALRAVFAKASIGDYSENVDIPESDDEFTELAMGVQVMVEVIRERIKELETEIERRKKVEEQIRHQALHDALTGLPNRKALEERMSAALAHAKRNNELLAVLYLDIDGFKPINDTYGHHIGDLLLKEFATRIRKSIRKEDIASRVGGDEFIIVLSQPKSKPNVVHVVRKLLKALKPAANFDPHKLFIRASIGIALYPDDGKELLPLLSRADSALLQAKQDGKNSYFFYENLPIKNKSLNLVN
ncbi:MAG TPA: GGDEF domain-containing protein [Patescibacteria group bacterium]